MKTFFRCKLKSFLICALIFTMLFGMTAYAAPSSLTGSRQNATVTATYYDITNSYETVDWDTWGHYKANLHTHSTVSDGDSSYSDMIEAYYAAGYDILAMTDHGTVSYGWNKKPDVNYMLSIKNTFKKPAKYYLSQERYTQITTGADRNGRGMTEIPLGIELNGMSAKKTHVNGWYADYGHHVLGIDSTDHEPMVRDYGNAGGITQINHIGEWTDAKDNKSLYDDPSLVQYFANIFLKYPTCVAMEVFNRADSMTKNDRYLWDKILQVTIPQGRVVYGTANDDAHDTGSINRSWEMFMLPENNAQNVRTALENGTYFACSVSSSANEYYTGDGVHPEINRVTVDRQAQTISLETKNGIVTEWITDGNEVIATGNTLDLSLYQDKIVNYVRAEVKGTGSIMLTQPFAVKKQTKVIEVPQIEAVENSGTVIDYENHYIYGLKEGITSYADYINTDLDYDIEVIPTPNGYGTGTKIDVIADNIVVDSYTAVIFGDVDGDSFADATDSFLLKLYLNFSLDFTGASEIASDINHDNVIDEMDYMCADLAGVFLYEIIQTK